MPLSCPRCQNEEKFCVVQHHGKEQGQVVWTVYNCSQCSFSWRDSEPSESIDHATREQWLNINPDNPELFRHNPPLSNK